MMEAVWAAGVRLRRRGEAVTIEALQSELYARTGSWFGRELVLEGLASLVLQTLGCVELAFAEEEEEW